MPTISAQPENQSVAVGATATFSVTAIGTGLGYQWSKNGTTISGATNASYTTPAAVAADDGAHFTVEVINVTGNTISSAATLTVTAATIAPDISTQPADQTVTIGNAATFTVSAGGTAPLSYQWSKNGTSINGATSSSYTTSAAVIGDTGATFTVAVTNDAGTTMSAVATLTVTSVAVAPRITTQPANQAVAVGAKPTFSVQANGTAPLAYQWFKNGAAITGATSSSYMAPATVIGDDGAAFSVQVSNSVANVMSALATLAVHGLAPTITQQPSDQSVALGASATFSVTATGTSPITYQWLKNGAVISAATASSYAIAATLASDNGAAYSVRVANGAGTVISSTASLTVNSRAPTVTAQPQSQSVVVGTTATFSVTASGTGTLTYQWSKNGKAIGGATASTYTTPATVSGDDHASFTVKITNANGTVTSNTATLTVSASGSVSVTPLLAPLTTSQTQQFTASVPSTWSVDGVRGGNGTLGTISSGGLYSPGSAGTHTITATDASSQSASATVAVTDLAGIFSFHSVGNDASRTGQNVQEYALTPAVLKSGNFGKVWSCPVDGAVYAQPLYVANLSIGGGKHNLVYIATEHDSVYAFDADSSQCKTYWTIQLTAQAGVTSVPAAATNCGDTPREIGITGTPVIDPSGPTPSLYFVAKTMETNPSDPMHPYFQRLHRVSLATGAELSGSPATITASTTVNGVTNKFDALYNHQKPGLALANGEVYIGWSSHCDKKPYVGWLMSYDAISLSQTAVFDVTPNSSSGQGGIWMSGGAPAVDSAGSVYLSSGNGQFQNAFSQANLAAPLASPTDLGMSFLKFDPGSLAPKDFYTPGSEFGWSQQDLDISSSGVTVLPDNAGPMGHRNLLFGSDKQDHLWLLDRDKMGGFSTISDNSVQQVQGPTSCSPSCVFATPAYYSLNKTIYLGIAGMGIVAIPMSNGAIAASGPLISSQSADSFGFPGPTPTITASTSGGAVVWGLDTSHNGTRLSSLGPALLRAYDATNLGTQLYSSTSRPADAGPIAVKFTVPVVANGRVYVGGDKAMTVYGPLH